MSEAEVYDINPVMQEFFDVRRPWGISVAPGDVTLASGASDYAPPDIDLTAHITRRYQTPLPLVTSPMDTVTEERMAIGAGLQGGLGVIHSGLTLETQKEMVRATKLHLNGLVDKEPITARRGQTIGELLLELERLGRTFRNIPVLGDDERFVGLLTSNDFEFCQKDQAMLVGDVMHNADELYIASSDSTPQMAYLKMKEHKQKALPLVDQNTGKLTSLYVWSDVTRIVEGNPEMFSLDDKGRLLTAAAVPTDESAFARIEAMADYLNILVIDTSTGDGKYGQMYFKEILDFVRSNHPHIDVVIGNLTNARSAQMFAELGADAIKVGQGIGSICSTSDVAAIGCEQLTAVHDCARAARSVNTDTRIIGDGGVSDGAVAAKVLAAGANSVMVGRMVAGTKETPGKPYYNEKGEFVKGYRGMGSKDAQLENPAAAARYADQSQRKIFSQGYKGEVPYVGEVGEVIEQNMYALRLAMAGCGAQTIRELHRRAAFWVRSANSQTGAHHITVLGN